MNDELVKLYKDKSKIEQKIRIIQSSCIHTNVIKSHGANTGNYDPTADCYWTDFHCMDCNKIWMEEGSK